MSTKHRRIQSGGDPAQGPHPDVANPTPSPSVGGDFPDGPSGDADERPQDQPDLDKFAERIGIKQRTDRSQGGSRSKDTSSRSSDGSRDWRTPVATALGGLATGARTVGERIKDVSDRFARPDADIDLAALRARVAKVRTVMLTSSDEHGALSSRPLTVQCITDTGDVHFVVARDADWVSPPMGAVNVAFVDGSTTWVSVSGDGIVDDDRRLLDDHWSPLLDSFFPDGRNSAVVLRVESTEWEYWTAPNKLVQLVEVAKARVSDDAPDLGDSGTVAT